MCIFPHLYTSAICMYLPDLYFCFAALYHIGTHSIGARADPQQTGCKLRSVFLLCAAALPCASAKHAKVTQKQAFARIVNSNIICVCYI